MGHFVELPSGSCGPLHVKTLSSVGWFTPPWQVPTNHTRALSSINHLVHFVREEGNWVTEIHLHVEKMLSGSLQSIFKKSVVSLRDTSCFFVPNEAETLW